MLTYLIAFLIALGLSTALIPNIKAVARRLKLFDRNLSSRKIHTAPIPRLGGIAIAAGFYAPLFGLLFHDNQVAQRMYQGFGFEQVGIRKGYYQPSDTDAVLMVLNLAGVDVSKWAPTDGSDS